MVDCKSAWHILSSMGLNELYTITTMVKELFLNCLVLYYTLNFTYNLLVYVHSVYQSVTG